MRKISDEVMKLCTNRDYNFGDKVFVKLSKDITVKGIIYGRASNFDIYQCYIIKMPKMPKKDAFITASHDRIQARKTTK